MSDAEPVASPERAAPRFRPAAADLDRPPALATGAIHLFALPLDPPEPTVRALAPLLSADERARAERFRFPRHRRRFTVGRAVLRRLLGAYTGRAPESLRFRYGEKGKPALEGPDPAPAFNLSNSHELALVAVARDDCSLGVDVEHLRRLEDAEKIAERFFSRAEREALRQVPAALKETAFFRCWTRKEAYIKAVGDGLAMKLDRFDVTLEPDEHCRFLALDGDPEAAAGWTLRHLEPEPGYVGALALPGRGWRLEGWRLTADRLAP